MSHPLESFARGLPKAELHIHIEGSLEPELIFELARRNGVALAYPSVEALRAAYAFTDLQSFLDIYYAGASVLIEEADFFEMAWAYFRHAAADNLIDLYAVDAQLLTLARGSAHDLVGKRRGWADLGVLAHAGVGLALE